MTLLGVRAVRLDAPSQGVLQGQHGMQDMTIGGKYAFIERSSPRWGAACDRGALWGLSAEQLHARFRAALHRHSEPAHRAAR